MEGVLDIWWVWLSAALALALIELMVPTSIFLGFALGALMMTGVVFFGLITNLSALLAIFAGLSLMAWIALKLVFKRQSSAARVVTRDINDG